MSLIHLKHPKTIVLLTIALISPITFANDPYWKVSLIPNKAELRSTGSTQQTLWVAGSKNSVFLSIDKGESWKDISPKLENEYDFRDIEVFDDRTAIVMAAGSGEKSKLFITRDQGKTWFLLHENTDALGFYDSITFWNDKEGALMGDPIDGHFVIELTKDQGKTWRRIATNLLPKLENQEVAFAASGNTIVSNSNGQIYFTTGGPSSYSYTSTDEGNSWSKSSIPIHNKNQTSGSYALAFNQQKELFALGGDYLDRPGSYKNAAVFSGGKWESITTGDRGLRTSMACIKSTCVMTGKLGSDVSYDNGKTWQIFSNNGFYSLTSNQTQILAAGAQGKVATLTIE